MAFSDPREIFEKRIQNGIAADPERAARVDAVFKFVITGEGGGVWMVNLRDAPGVTEGDEDAGCVIMMSTADFLDMNNGKLDPQAAFMSGRMNITGDWSLAFKLGEILGGGAPRE
ncbi:MAG: SCP2 sterol-binding domain-containing protein [Chrysiogenetes bacterium]|nr:SCP2 sterol-binding domain-containing protein [Chrysiogenetes bacterium]